LVGSAEFVASELSRLSLRWIRHKSRDLPREVYATCPHRFETTILYRIYNGIGVVKHPFGNTSPPELEAGSRAPRAAGR
jgi:hypothetical protein